MVSDFFVHNNREGRSLSSSFPLPSVYYSDLSWQVVGSLVNPPLAPAEMQLKLHFYGGYFAWDRDLFLKRQSFLRRTY